MRIVLAYLFLVSSMSMSAQTLFSVDGEDTSVAEFKKMYEKNSTEADNLYSKESLDKYVDLFVNFKLKLKEAEDQKLAENPFVKSEIKEYENRLIQSTFDKAIMQDLVEEAYQRSKEEVCISHIVFNVRTNAGQKEADEVYKQAMKVRESLLNGGDFRAAVVRYSTDYDSKPDGGDLGCFTALQVSIYEIENAAYGLQVGEISKPVRTYLGYHLIRLNDRRPASGMVSASQIFVRSNEKMDKEDQDAALSTIYAAHNKLKSGSKFSEVVSEYSEDDSSKRSGGKLDPFSVGTYEAAFEKGIFDLRAEGDYSEPIKTSVGWHIFKLDKKEEMPSFKDREAELRSEILQDVRYEMSRKEYGNSLKKKYNYEQDEEAVGFFRKEAAPGITIEGWQVPTIVPLSDPFFTIGDRAYTGSNFVNYVRREHTSGRFLSFTRFYENFESDALLNYHREKMIETDPDLSALLTEYRDGIVVFNLMEKEVWAPEKTSDERLEAYYNENVERYNRPDQVAVRSLTAGDTRTAKKLKRLLRKGDASYGLTSFLSGNNNVIEEKILLTRNEAKIGGKDLWRLGESVSRINSEGKMEFLTSLKLEAGERNEFSDIKGSITADYQKVVESNWINELRSKYPVILNEAVLESLVK